MITYDELIDEVMTHFSQGVYADEVAGAKSEFNKIVGIFDEESIDLENKITLFLDWYVFNRPLKNKGIPPIQMVAKEEDFSIDPEKSLLYKNLCASRYSIFEFLKVKGEDVHIKDLFSGYKMILKKSPIVVGFNKEELFSARVFPYEDSFVFSKAFCIHPKEAAKFIQKEIKKQKKEDKESQVEKRVELIFKLIRMRFKIDQYKHVKLEDIYNNESRLRV